MQNSCILLPIFAFPWHIYALVFRHFFFPAKGANSCFSLTVFCTMFHTIHQLSLLHRERICSCKPSNVAPSSRKVPTSHTELHDFRWESSHWRRWILEVNWFYANVLVEIDDSNVCGLTYRKDVSQLKIHYKEIENTLWNKNW